MLKHVYDRIMLELFLRKKFHEVNQTRSMRNNKSKRNNKMSKLHAEMRGDGNEFEHDFIS